MNPIGIDLGTTYSAITKWVNTKRKIGSEPYVMPQEGNPALPSKVYLDKDDDGTITFIVGKTAAGKGLVYPDQYVSAVKRKIDDKDHQYNILGNTYSPVDISSEILKHLLTQVEAVDGPNTYVPLGMVVTIPYYFLQNQRLNTKSAALKALKDLYGERCENTDNLFLSLIPEPIAAGLDYAFTQADEDLNGEKFLIFDLGGGTFDVTIFSLEQKPKEIKFVVEATDGDARLGGEDFDESLFNWICESEGLDFKKLTLKERGRALKKILPEITSIKEQLTPNPRAELIVPFGREHLDSEITRVQLEDCLNGKKGHKRNYLNDIDEKLDKVLEKAGIGPNDITSVLMTGGSSLIPKIRELVQSRFGASKVRTIAAVNLAVARGASIYAAYKLDEKLVKNGEDRKHLTKWDKIEIKEKTVHNLGIPTAKVPFRILLPENQFTPVSKTLPFQPTKLSDDGTKALLKKIDVLQGDTSTFLKVGQVEVGNIYTHGRSLRNIRGKITFTAVDSLVKVKIFVPQGKADKSDILIEKDLSLEDKDK